MSTGDSARTNPVQIQKHLGGIDYPARKQELIDRARPQDAPEEVMSVLRELPEQQYESPADVSKAVGRIE